MDSIKTKVCSECKKELDVSEFYPRRNSKIGYSCCCKPCHKKRGIITRKKLQDKPKQIPETKTCSKCGETYPAEMFNKDNDRISGLTSWCKICISKHREDTIDRRREHDRNYYAKNKERWIKYAIDHADHIKQGEKIRRAKNYRRLWAINTIKGHVNRGFQVSITIDELHDLAKSVDKCPICDCDLKWAPGKIAVNSPTLDRINNGKEISTNNVWILCHRCNTIKRDLPMKRFVEYCRMVVSKFGTNTMEQAGMDLNPENEVVA